MPKFTFIAEYETGERITFETNKEIINDVLEDFNLFLRGCGYFPDGTLDYIPDEEYYGERYDDYPELHSEYYYDTDRNKPIHEWTAIRRGEE